VPSDAAPNIDVDIDVDVVVVGAGMAGLYMLHHLRAQGFSATVFEQGDGVGGTWFWNRYPGARCDVPSLEYSFGFSAELQQEWEWSEVFPGQEELEHYLNHVADRFDLRRDIRLSTRVVAAIFDEEHAVWTVTTENGEQHTSRFVVMATGCLSAPQLPTISGLDRFTGTIVQTSRWPREPVALAGQRVGVIGTGSSGVQTIPEIARIAGHLTVFQRTPTFTWPSHNGPLDPEVQRTTKAKYPELRRRQRKTVAGVTGQTGAIILQEPSDQSLAAASDEERQAVLAEKGWDASRAWNDISTNPAANEIACELYREMVRSTVTDPETAEALSPRDFPIGCKRPVVDTDYFATFNRDNVTLIDLRGGGIEEITETGIRANGDEFDLDVIVFATGFDAMTGALARIDIRGRAGRYLRDEWLAGPRTLLGLQTSGFPNFFTITGPGSPSVLANVMVGIEHHVEWIGACLEYLRAHDHATIEPSVDAQDAWVDHVNTVAKGTTMTAENCNSWYLGANIPGKPRVFLPYIGGLAAYITRAEAVAAADYEGFVMAGTN